jgi:hypothetical protein
MNPCSSAKSLAKAPPAQNDGEINAMVEGSKFRESHVLKILSWRAKEGGMPRPLVVHCPDL